MRIALLISMLFFLSACGTNQQKQKTSEQSEDDLLFVKSLQWAKKREQEKKSGQKLVGGLYYRSSDNIETLFCLYIWPEDVQQRTSLW